MTSTTELINEAIATLAARPAVFVLSDVAAYADLEGCDAAIESALLEHCANQEILTVGEELTETPDRSRYLGRIPVGRWWIESTLHWAKAGQGYMAESDLAREMALAFDTRPWNVVPDTIVEIGRQWATIAYGYYPNTFTFPWAIVIHSNSQLADGLRLIYDSGGLDCEAIVDNVLHSLTERESDIVKRRGGFDTGQIETLERLGNSYGVTKERIRQIEQKAWRKLRHPARQRGLIHAFAADFVKTGGSLLITKSGMTPLRKFLHSGIGLSTVLIPELGLRFIGKESPIASYCNVLRDVNSYLDSAIERPHPHSSALLQLLSTLDGVVVTDAEQDYWYEQVRKNRSLMLREALRSLGRAAHYEEIADECYRLFPDCNMSVRSLHAALSAAAAPDKEQFGIVWTRRKGRYGLKEHSYSRDNIDIFDRVAQIVEDIFANTYQPVSEETVITEISKYRREAQRSSVVMALTFNDRVKSVGHGQYIPAGVENGITPDKRPPQYDIDAAFEAFLSDDGDDGANS